MSMAVGDNKSGAIADINVTPMADIMIVLLIIFMVITPLLQKGVDVKLPVAANTKEKKEEQKTIQVTVRNDANHTVYLGGKVVPNPETELADQIKQRLEEATEDQKTVQLKCDVNLDYVEVLKVMDLLHKAGVEDIALITDKKVQS
jgi:biopolymer transport protein TolR